AERVQGDSPPRRGHRRDLDAARYLQAEGRRDDLSAGAGLEGRGRRDRRELQPDLAPRVIRGALSLDRRTDRVHRAARVLDPARGEHDPAVDLRTATRD